MRNLSLLAAPLLALASSVAAPAFRADPREQLDVIAANSARWYWFTLLLLAASILLVPAYLTLAAMVRERSPRLAAVGGGLAVLGSVIAVGDVMSQFTTWKMAAYDRGQMAQLLDAVENAPGASVVFAMGGFAILIGSGLLTAGLLRGRVGPAWAAVGLSVAILANVVAFTASSGAGVAASWLILLASMGAIGMRELRLRPAVRPAPARSSG